ncbi:MAG: hypothetical protein R3F18_12720 [Lysobacterales bacterium]
MRFITGGIGAALLLALAGCASTAPRAATEVVIAPPTDEQAVSGSMTVSGWRPRAIRVDWN